jgi:hypothetical protein
MPDAGRSGQAFGAAPHAASAASALPGAPHPTLTRCASLPRSIGRNIKHLIDREDEPHCFRLHKERVYYVSERVMRQATSVGRDDLVALGTCFGKFTKTKKFHLKVTALDFVAQHAKVRRPADEVARGGGRRESRGGSGISPPSGAPPRAPRSTRCG